MNPAPMNPAPMNPAPMNPAPMNPAPMNPAPMNPAPMNPAPMNPATTMENTRRKVSRRLLPPLFVMFVPSFLGLGGSLIGLHGIAGLEGWQWMFLVEGAPTVVLALAVPWLRAAGCAVPAGMSDRGGDRRGPLRLALVLTVVGLLISGFGNLGGFLGRYLMGVAESATGSDATGLYAIAAIVAAGVCTATTLRWAGAPTTPSREERTTDDTHRALRR
ncbi:hypothetical protein [Streptomyces iranensis]|uniref:hypothetical protein n=1 Tax=Streptomyces iranensis TaxID=576784 RepID=UPI0039B779AD